jgi:hypothetical protein
MNEIGWRWMDGWKMLDGWMVGWFRLDGDGHINEWMELNVVE